MTAPRLIGTLRAFAATLCLALAAGCGGGGGGSGGDTPPPGGQLGSLTLGLAGGAPAGYRHVWVTIDAVALHTDANRAWAPTDSSWQVLRLPAPRTIDLTTSINGVISPLMAGRTLAAGTYGQLRLFVRRHDDLLADSARALQLDRNAQVDHVDADGTLHQVPLEFTDNEQGLRLAGPIVVDADVATDITLQWDLERSLVRFAADDGIDRVTMRPDLRWYDIAQTGAIIGLVEKSQFCEAGAPSPCISDVVATALLPSADGRMKVSVRSTPVIVGDQHAAFALYPLPALPSGGTVDVMIRGRNMRTMIVRDVPASAADLLAANPTQLGVDSSGAGPVAAPLVPALSNAGDSRASLAAPASPMSAQLLFAQTVGAGELPHEVVAANTDPFSGLLARPVVLPSGPLRVAAYTSTGALSFADVTPQEGADGFSVMTLGTRYDEPSNLTLISAPGGSDVSFTAAAAPRRGDIATGTLTVHLAGGSTATTDAAQLVVSDAGGIVATQDISALIGVAGAQATLQLPAGAQAASLGATAVYAVSVRTWRRAAPSSSVVWARAPTVADLRDAGSAAVTVTLP
ncbi:hypothetical protein BURC_03221 [Burkholderiaceae bacterium]|nr:hypothetical protein BURC_03221 [Burkholderiaceae bacterium]